MVTARCFKCIAEMLKGLIVKHEVYGREMVGTNALNASKGT
jgi:hypothetical protein